MAYYQKGMIVASEHTHGIIAAHCPKAYKIKSFDNDTAKGTQKDLRDVMKRAQLYTESTPSHQVGRKYLYRLFIYADHETRRLCFQVLSMESV
jgi:hypothetical protein